MDRWLAAPAACGSVDLQIKTDHIEWYSQHDGFHILQTSFLLNFLDYVHLILAQTANIGSETYDLAMCLSVSGLGKPNIDSV